MNIKSSQMLVSQALEVVKTISVKEAYQLSIESEPVDPQQNNHQAF